MPPRVLCLLIAPLLTVTGVCAEPGEGEATSALVQHVAAQRDGRAAWSIDFAALKGDRSSLPIGVFDSGIGGLTVLEALLKIDAFNNDTLQPTPDGIPDFAGERFIYFGDQANMPYGNYPAKGAEPFLKELIVKDAVFLLGTRYRTAPGAAPRFDKPPVKAIVIACNTATAYGLEEIRGALQRWQLDLPVIGVVEAGARAVAEELPADGARPLSVAVLATVGTCASNAYPKAIGRAVGRSGKRAPAVVQQGSVGLAGAIEGNQAFLAPAEAAAPYEGPAVGNAAAPLEPASLPAYGFDPAGLRGDPTAPGTLRLASVPNYARYDVATLLQKSPPPSGAPIEIVVLGCTHFPMARAELAEAFARTRQFKAADGSQPYAAAVAEQIRFVDPAQATAKELFRELARGRLRAKSGPTDLPCRFFLSVPDPNAPGIRLTADRALEAAYKQSRRPGDFAVEDTVVIPVNAESLPAPARPLVKSLTAVWQRLSSPAE